MVQNVMNYMVLHVSTIEAAYYKTLLDQSEMRLFVIIVDWLSY